MNVLLGVLRFFLDSLNGDVHAKLFTTVVFSHWNLPNMINNVTNVLQRPLLCACFNQD